MNEERNVTSASETEETPITSKKSGGKRLVGSAAQEAQAYRGKRLLVSEEDPPEPSAPDDSPSEETAPSEPENRKTVGRWFSRLQDAALDLSDQVLDWRDDMTDRFSDMASDPENESLPAKMIRQSEQIVSGIEDQERETDELTSEEQTRRAGRMQKSEEHLNPDGSRPKFVFYTMENAPTRTRAGTPIELEHPTLIDKNGKVISSDQSAESAAAVSSSAPQDPEPAPHTPASAETAPAAAEPKPSESAPAPSPAKETAADKSAAQEPAPRPRPRRSAHSRTDAEKSSQAAEQDRRSVSSTPPTSKEHYHMMTLSRTVQYWLFFVVLGIAAIAGLMMPFRSETSALEGRDLAVQSEVTFSGFADGSWFTEFDRWYSDTFPGRDRLAGLYDSIGSIFGFDNDSTASADTEDAAEAAETAEAGTDGSETDESAETTSADEADTGESTDTDGTSEEADGISV